MIKCETTSPYTSSKSYGDLVAGMNIAVESYKKNNKIEELLREPLKCLFPTEDLNAFLSSQFLKKTSESDHWCLNLQIACYSYWVVFETRFLDYLEMFILKKMVYFFQENLEDIFDRKFSPASNQITQQYLSEDPTITNKRKKLATSIKSLTDAKKELEKLEKWSN